MITKNTVIVFSICLLMACHTSEIKHDSITGLSKSKETVQIDSNYNYINLIPDSLRTREQRIFIKHLSEILAEHVTIKNNHMVFTLSKKQLVSLGIPSPYYDVIQKNIRDNNKYFEKNGIKDVDSIWQNSLLEIKDSFK